VLSAIAAVVIGGTNILGGRGRYLGIVASVILIVSFDDPDAGRQIIYGAVIIVMLLAYRQGPDEAH
jgi:ribose transport system permease protein